MIKEMLSNNFNININKEDETTSSFEVISNSFTLNINKREIISDDFFDSIELITEPDIKGGKYVRVALKLKTKSNISNLVLNPVIDADNITIQNIQWEKGSVLTDYRESVSELSSKTSEIKIGLDSIESTVSSHDSRLGSAESSIVQQANEISQKVSVNGVVSSINQTSEAIKINANKIQLEGTTTVGSGGNYVKIEQHEYKSYVNHQNAITMGAYNENGSYIPVFYMGKNGFNASSSGFDGSYFALKNYGSYQHLAFRRRSDGTWSYLEFNENGNIKVNAANKYLIESETDFSKNVHLYGGNLDLRDSDGYIRGRFNYQGLVTNQISNMSGGTINIQGNLRSMYSSQNLGTTDGRWAKLYSVSAPDISSDIRLKENIQYIENEEITKPNSLIIDKITNDDMYNFVKDDLHIAEYNYLGEDNSTFGFIAQDLIDTKVGSKFIHEDETEEKYLSYDSGAYTNVLASALKKAIEKIEILEREIEILKAG